MRNQGKTHRDSLAVRTIEPISNFIFTVLDQAPGAFHEAFLFSFVERPAEKHSPTSQALPSALVFVLTPLKSVFLLPEEHSCAYRLQHCLMHWGANLLRHHHC